MSDDFPSIKRAVEHGISPATVKRAAKFVTVTPGSGLDGAARITRFSF